MEARNKPIKDWFPIIEQGLIALPRFQRFEAWDRSRIAGVLENVVREPSLPIGALLVLDVGAEEPFHSRPISGAPPLAANPNMHLLDGQQRMTALWRSLTNNYPDLRLFISLEDEAHPAVETVRVWDRKGVMQPVWAHDPKQTLERKLIPAAILRPGNDGEQVAQTWWKESGQDMQTWMAISKLRNRVASYSIPFLELPRSTDAIVALDVFINMNTSAAPLNDFDIVVAQLESAVGNSLHDMMDDLHREVPYLREYRGNEDLALSVGALLLGKPPLRNTYLEKNFGEGLASIWPQVRHGIRRGIAFLHEEAMFSDQLVPTDVAIYLACALWGNVPADGADAEGRARTLVRKAVWRASFTDRYLKTAATRAYSDYRRLAALLSDPSGTEFPELFDEVLNPLPDIEELKRAGWPSKRDRLARAILCASLRAGGYDFADGAPATPPNLSEREFHHIVPVDVLACDRNDPLVAKALNCALVSWKTNRKIAAKTPAEYLAIRAAEAHLGEQEVRQRLISHLIPYDELVNGDYEAFLDARAKLIKDAARQLCDGHINLRL